MRPRDNLPGVRRAMIAAHEAAWKNAKHPAQWSSTLATYAYPVFGAQPVAAVEYCARAQGCRADLDHEARDGEPRARPDCIGHRLGDRARLSARREPSALARPPRQTTAGRRKVRRVKNHPALPYADLPAFASKLRERNGISARALEFAILTAGRTSEVIGARWSEIDIGTKVWTVPAERMKAGREHRVPLSTRALEILEALPRESDFVFWGVGRESRSAIWHCWS